MELKFSAKFKKDYRKLSSHIKKQTGEKLDFLASNLSHPSLRVKKIKGRDNFYEASITMNYRMTFRIDENGLFLLRVGTHDILEK